MAGFAFAHAVAKLRMYSAASDESTRLDRPSSVSVGRRLGRLQAAHGRKDRLLPDAPAGERQGESPTTAFVTCQVLIAMS